jgi:multiple antibiotic resistance protein
MEQIITLVGALFSIMNPLGTIPIFVGLTQHKSKKEINQIALKTVKIVLSILMLSYFTGKYLLILFGVHAFSLKLAGSFVILSSGFALLTGKFSDHKGMKKREKDDAFNREEIALTPLAIPMLAGPGTISFLISLRELNTQVSQTMHTCIGIVVISIIIFIMLKYGLSLVQKLGASGINALGRIIGFIVIGLGFEIILSAILEWYLLYF